MLGRDGLAPFTRLQLNAELCVETDTQNRATIMNTLAKVAFPNEFGPAVPKPLQSHIESGLAVYHDCDMTSLIALALPGKVSSGRAS